MLVASTCGYTILIMMKHQNLVAIGFVGLVVVGSLAWEHVRKQRETTSPKPTVTVTAFNKTAYSIGEADSLWVIINKQRQLVDGFVPPNLVSLIDTLQIRATALPDTQALIKAAVQAGLALTVQAAYTSQSDQAKLYADALARSPTTTPTTVPQARTSENQTGLAVDVSRTDKLCDQTACFATTKEGVWLATDAYQYGYIIRYEQGKQASTGYIYEPWHLRYVGKALAAELHQTGQSMEEFFGLAPTTIDKARGIDAI
jgi:D-alanyl-D-alanine carboxypeptidase